MRVPTLRVDSPAKINLFLEILGRRPDGYHTLSTLFQEITLKDELRARIRSDGQVALKTNHPDLPTGETNLICRAAAAFRRLRPGPSGMDFVLKKTIPLGAGLGGGSSNAAGALRACRALWAPCSSAELHRTAAALGADVPFFLEGGWAAARGIGDRLTFYPPPMGPPFNMVLVFPRVFSSTPEAYRALRFPLTRRRTRLRLTQAIQDGAPPQVWARWMFNRLEEVVIPRLPVVGQVKRALIQAGCIQALMSGSGSSVFGVTATRAEAQRVSHRLRLEGWDIWVVRSVSTSRVTPLIRQEGGHHGNFRDSRFVARGRKAEGVRHRDL